MRGRGSYVDSDTWNASPDLPPVVYKGPAVDRKNTIDFSSSRFK